MAMIKTKKTGVYFNETEVIIKKRMGKGLYNL